MKTDKNDMDLQELLYALDHAGRDERRQQELGDMIDSMAAAEDGTHHGFWWWGGRVAAAACVLFFISIAVRIWFIPTVSGDTQVAEAEVPEVVPAVADSVAPAATAMPGARLLRRPVVAEPEPIAAEPVAQPMELPVEELYVEDTPTDEPMMVEPEPVEDTVPTAILPAEVLPEPAPLALSEPDSKLAPAPTPRRRRFLVSLFRIAEPSEMEGTTLALLQF